MNLHGQIMNIPADASKAGTDDPRMAYLHGHRDARHAAAELANKADAVAAAAHRLLDWIALSAEHADCIDWPAVMAGEVKDLARALVELDGMPVRAALLAKAGG